MPLLKIATNTKVDAHDEILKEATTMVATILGKPPAYVQIILKEDEPMAFAGTREPCAYLELYSLGLPEAQTEAMSATLCTFMATKLGIAPNRTYIQFHAPARHLWGWDSKTFA